MPGWLQRLLGRPDPAPRRITTDATGFSLTVGRVTSAYPWTCVNRIAAYKQDLHTHDQIVLLIEVIKSDTSVLTLAEDTPGFAGLFQPMEEALGIDPSWYLEIMTPVFEPTPMVLYLRHPEED